ncbi:MAG: CrcB family protein [Thermoleophilia bacterium]
MSVGVWLGVAALGAVGAVLRFAVSTAVRTRTTTPLPLGTLAVNLIGSLVLGLLAGAGVGGDARLLVAGGLLGALTTFSSWMLELVELGAEHARRLVLATLVAPLALGLGVTAAGWAIGRALW